MLKVSHFAGPLSLLRGEHDDGDIAKAAAITAHYSKAKDLGKIEVTYKVRDEEDCQSVIVSPVSREEMDVLMVNE